MTTTARWDNNNKILMVKWYGSTSEDGAAYLYPSKNGYRMIFEGNEETLEKVYPTMPLAEDALRDIISWQNQY